MTTPLRTRLGGFQPGAVILDLDGRRNRDIFPVLFGRELGEEDLSRRGAEKEALYRELSRGRIRSLPGLHEWLEDLDSAAIPFALATSAPAENVPHTLGEIGLRAARAAGMRTLAVTTTFLAAELATLADATLDDFRALCRPGR